MLQDFLKLGKIGLTQVAEDADKIIIIKDVKIDVEDQWHLLRWVVLLAYSCSERYQGLSNEDHSVNCSFVLTV